MRFLGAFFRSILENKLKVQFFRAQCVGGALGSSTKASCNVSCTWIFFTALEGQIFHFFILLRVIFLLELSWDFRWISPNFYCILKPYKCHWSSLFNFHNPPRDVLLFWITWFINKKTQNTYEVAWLWKKMDYNDSNHENKTKSSSNHEQLL